uniref:Uncharacterized protein n=1 Tax=viral metagenome TaxID=1070528 RepID=A0A6C0HTJ2_9ZZZZ
MSDYNIYIIELENNKFFLHVSLPIYKNLLFKECSLMFDFVKKNPPIFLINTVHINDVLEIDYHVKHFMRVYGIDNVRGGNYTNENLTPQQISFLKKEISISFLDYDKQNDIIEEVIQIYQYEKFDENEKEKIEDGLKKYNNKKYLLSLLTNDNDDYLYIIENLKWLKDEINNVRSNFENISDPKNMIELIKIRRYLPTNVIDRYKNILKKMDSIVSIYLSLDKDKLEPYLTPYLKMKISSIKKYEDLEIIFIKKPRFILDNIFLHPYSITDWDKYCDSSDKLLENLFNISYTILNIIQELNFDLSTYPEYFETKMNYILQYNNSGNLRYVPTP